VKGVQASMKAVVALKEASRKQQQGDETLAIRKDKAAKQNAVKLRKLDLLEKYQDQRITKMQLDGGLVKVKTDLAEIEMEYAPMERYAALDKTLAETENINASIAGTKAKTIAQKQKNKAFPAMQRAREQRMDDEHKMSKIDQLAKNGTISYTKAKELKAATETKILKRDNEARLKDGKRILRKQSMSSKDPSYKLAIRTLEAQMTVIRNIKKGIMEAASHRPAKLGGMSLGPMGGSYNWLARIKAGKKRLQEENAKLLTLADNIDANWPEKPTTVAMTAFFGDSKSATSIATKDDVDIPKPKHNSLQDLANSMRTK